MNTLFATVAGLGVLAAIVAPLAAQSSLIRASLGAPSPSSTEQDRGSGRMANQNATVHAALVGWRGSGRIGSDSESVG